MPVSFPNLSYETDHRNKMGSPICGVDEAGRGPLAGPVIAAAVILDPNQIPKGLNDSKVLSATAREQLLNSLMDTAQIGIGISEPEEIDRINILQASLKAMTRAVENLSTLPKMALIDGNHIPPNLPCAGLAIIKGDSKSLSIAAASIAAKVTRDRLMQEANIRFSGYDFGQHQGYATRAHKTAISALGPAPIHRWSFKGCARI